MSYAHVLELAAFLVLGTVVAILAWRVQRLDGKLSTRAPEPAINELRSELRRLDSDIDDVFDRLKRMASRKGMQARREDVANGAMLPGETPEQWKARMRKAKSKGAIAPEE